MIGIFCFLNDMENYEERKVARTKVGKLEVSTVYTSDEGYETAICDENGAHPVERYLNKESAIKGHAKWCKKAKTIRVVNKLGGMGGFVDDKMIALKK